MQQKLYKVEAWLPKRSERFTFWVVATSIGNAYGMAMSKTPNEILDISFVNGKVFIGE